MLISVYTHEVYDAYGRIKYVQPVVSVSHSPREGLDHETIRKLENDMQELVRNGLFDAIKRGNNGCDKMTH